MFIELLGYLGMIFVFLSIFTNDKITFRIFGMVGCMVLLVQAVFIGSVSLAIINIVMFSTHFVKLFLTNENLPATMRSYSKRG